MAVNRERASYRSAIQRYHAFPAIILLTLIAVYLGMFFATGNTVVAALAAATPSLILLWFWVDAARQLDRWVCAKCGKPFPKKMRWKYPPDNCPDCGEPVA
jgi:hypothetical protein